MKYQVSSPVQTGAVTPVPAQASAKAWRYGMVHISGYSGTVGVASPKPAALPDGPLMRSAQPSYNSPDYIFPSTYYTTITNMGPGSDGIRVQSTNELPIPAQSYNLVPQVAQRRPRFGGLQQVTWPPAPMAWQNIAAGSAGYSA